MIVRAAVVPSAPLLVPELAGWAAAEMEPVRRAAIEAAAELRQVGSRWLVVAGGDSASCWGPSTRGSFAGFGADVRVRLGPDDRPDRTCVDPLVPLPVLVAGWLRHEAGADDVSIEAQILPRDASRHECAGVGTRLVSRAERSADPIALLVVADGAATHTARAPGTFHPGAEAFDREVATAFATGDSAALAALEPARCAELWADGRVGWQVLAALMSDPAEARSRHFSAPFGVGYHVASWRRGTAAAPGRPLRKDDTCASAPR